MGAERAQIVFDRLLVADVYKNPLEHPETRFRRRRDMQSRLCHQCQQSDTLECYTLAASVRPADDKGVEHSTELEVEGDGRGKSMAHQEDRMSRLPQFYRPTLDHDRLYSDYFQGVLRFRIHDVQSRKEGQIRDHRIV